MRNDNAPATPPGPTVFPPPSGDGPADVRADVIVVGAGPGGSATACHLARCGVDVLLLEKSPLPRPDEGTEKVCGGVITPRTVHQLTHLGIDLAASGFKRTRGVRMVCNDRRVEVDWPASHRFPDFGFVCTRRDLDARIAAQAAAAGARLHTGVRVTAPLLDAAGRVIGVHAQAGPDARPVTCRAPLVVSAEGSSARLALAMGIDRHPTRPVGTGVRRYYHSPELSRGEYLEVRGDVPCPGTDRVLPGYGWILPLGDGRVNAGAAVYPARDGRQPDVRKALRHWLDRTPEEWRLRGEEHADGPVRGAALPMGFNRTPHYLRGLVLVGDSGGMINPVNAEGIAHTLEAAQLAAEAIVLALGRPPGPRREQALDHYARTVHRQLGGFYRLGNVLADRVFSRSGYQKMLSGTVMNSPHLLELAMRMLVLTNDQPARDWTDHVVNAVLRVVPAPRRHTTARARARSAGGS